ncbi:MAG: hypothetical protein CMD58_05385 [Gammaproteobacteria bacterium]|nr:hypothetical protein [Gammaproteobacteria bacterium]
MILNEIAMIGADTSRTLFYIEELIKHNLKPNHIVLLINENDDLLPGQNTNELSSKIINILDSEKISYEISPNHNINSKEVIDILERRNEPTFIFSGFGGVLLKNDVLSISKNFLHVHGGYLPDYKGSTTNYFSLLAENMIGASSILLTKDIDCGPVLVRKKFLAPTDRTKIDHIYDSKARAEVLVETLQRYLKLGFFDFELKENTGGETFYVIHPVLKHLAILG